MRYALPLSLLLLMTLPPRAAEMESRLPPAAPPALQFAAGTLLGAIGGLAGGYVGSSLENCGDPENDAPFCGLTGAVFGGGLGYSVGNVVGVSIVGRGFYGKGYWAATSIGNFFAVAASIYLLTQWPNGAVGGGKGIAAYAVMIPLFTTISYHGGRHWDLRAGFQRESLALRVQTGF